MLAADAIVETFGELNEAAVPLPIIIDQLITYGAFASVELVGKYDTATQFRAFADKIEAGFFERKGPAN